jgi:hypothetical protein
MTVASPPIKATISVRTQEIKPNRVPPLLMPFVLSIALAAFCFLPMAQQNPRLAWSVAGASAALLCFWGFLRRQVRQSGRALRYEFVPRAVHYVQMVMHSSVYAYWGWYWRTVYHFIPLIIAQIVFVYALDMLVCWSRRDKWILGFGPFPIVLSTNLFLWFKPDWFFLQFLMLATGVLCKEFLTWQREGRRAHIFNPSAIALFIFSVVLILTHGTHLTWGEEIAVSFDRPPHIYLEIFLLGLVVQGLFSVTLVTLSAASSLYLMNLFYTGSTGLYYFVDTNIPAAVFLGLHLLVTDPATSPRKNFGKIIFGAGYGIAAFAAYWLLGLWGVPTFYDKLVCVPILNLMVRMLDRWSDALASRIHWQLPKWNPRLANFAHMGIWICLFAVMTATGFLGGKHPGSDAEFWRTACADGKGAACTSWVRLEKISCYHGSGSACLVLGDALKEGQMVTRDLTEAGKVLARGCEVGVHDSCSNFNYLVAENKASFFEAACGKGDGESCFLLGSLYHSGIGVPRDDGKALAVMRQSCSSGWARGCGGLGEFYRAGWGTSADPELALKNFDHACGEGIAPSCFSASSMYRDRNDQTRAQARLRDACELSSDFYQSDAAYAIGDPTKTPQKVPAACSGFKLARM